MAVKVNMWSPSRMPDSYSERCTVRYPDWQIGEHSNGSIQAGIAESQIMTYFMDSQEQILICSCPNYVCRQEECPRKEVRISKKICCDYLESYDS